MTTTEPRYFNDQTDLTSKEQARELAASLGEAFDNNRGSSSPIYDQLYEELIDDNSTPNEVAAPSTNVGTPIYDQLREEMQLDEFDDPIVESQVKTPGRLRSLGSRVISMARRNGAPAEQRAKHRADKAEDRLTALKQKNDDRLASKIAKADKRIAKAQERHDKTSEDLDAGRRHRSLHNLGRAAAGFQILGRGSYGHEGRRHRRSHGSARKNDYTVDFIKSQLESDQ